MNFEFLIPIKDAIVAQLLEQSQLCLAKNIQIHTTESGLPNLDDVQIAIFGVQEDRNSVDNHGCGENLDDLREEFYQLFPGNWHTQIVDLGNIQKGNTPEDTYFAVSEITTVLLKKNIIPVIIGGSQELTYVNYRAYDALEQTVNVVAIDNTFDIGNVDDALTSKSYLSKIIMQKPNNLFNYSNLGYQTYFNSQDEIALLNSMFFDAYRLGECKKLEIVEPVLRDADIVSIDIGSIRQSDAPGNKNATPNGFYGDEICAIARYAGISDKVSSFGIYEYNSTLDKNKQTAQLIAQIIWYFIEGVNNRAKDYPFTVKDNYQKFTVLLEDDDPINFYKSNKTGRWWMEINMITDNKYKRHALVPCTYQDYVDTTNQIIPQRWYNGMSKMI